MTTFRGTLYLIDGSALIYRSYFAFIRNPLVNSRGENTSAPFGVTNTLLSLIREHNPDYLAIVFDTPKPTFRHKLYPDYKATRQKMPDELADQIPRVYEAVDAMGIPRIELEGFEADDIIGTMAVHAAAEGFDVMMVTGDKDFMQLVGPHITQYVPVKDERITPAYIENKFGFAPCRIIDYLALMGDASDNVPGVPKVGEKTALALLGRFGSLDAVLEHAGEIDKPSIREAVASHRDQALLSRDLVTIRTDVPVPFEGFDSLRFTGVDAEPARAFFREMEFTSLMNALDTFREIQPGEAVAVTDDGIDDFFGTLAGFTEIAVDTETTSIDPVRASLVGISVAAGDSKWYLPVGHTGEGNLDKTALLPRLRRLLADPAVKKIGHNAKYDTIVLRRNGFDVAPFAFDTMLAAYVLDPGSRSYALDTLAGDLLNRGMQSITELIGKGKQQRSFAEVPIPDAAAYSCDDADVTLKLKGVLAPRLEQDGLLPLFTDLEMPLMDVLIAMEMHGVMLDVPFLGEMSKELAAGMERIEHEIHEIAGEEFNVNSTKQLSGILFDKIGLKPVRKTKTGYSTDTDVLTRLAPKHELPAKVLEYRQLTKLKSTYVDALPAIVNPETGRVHTSFNQAVASTGRLSSSDPNLQNIPIRTELGRRIRKAFVAPPGHVLASADYSQVELRIMAHISGDPVLTEAFRNGEDVHARTASVLFGVPPGDVTPEHRRRAKTINFGVMYGMGAYALSEQLGIHRDEAKQYIDNYFETHTGVREYMERTVREAESAGYVTTMLGRKRYLPDLASPNHNIAEFGRRTAINTPIQGSAADLIKRAMINVHRRLGESHPQTAMILQVHDELVFEIPAGEVASATSVIRETMEGAMELSVPLVVDIGTGANWLEAH